MQINCHALVKRKGFWRINLLLIVLLISGLCFLYYMKGKNRSADSYRVNILLHEISNNDAELNKHVLESMRALSDNYDALDSHLHQMKRSLSELKALALHDDQHVMNDIHALMVHLTEKRSAIERFKPANLTILNAESYLTEAVNDFAKEGPVLAAKIDDVYRKLIAFRLHPSQLQERAVRKTMEIVRGLESFPPSSQFRSLFLEMDLFLKNVKEVQKDLDMILYEIPIVESITKISSAFNLTFQQMKARSKSIQQWLFLLAVILTCYVLCLIFVLLNHAKKLQTDITARLKAEEEKEKIAHELEIQRMALDEHSIVSITDEKGVMTYVNRRFCDTTGFTEHELLGHRFREIFTTRYHDDKFYDELWDTLYRQEIWRSEELLQRKSGDVLWTYTSIVPVLEDGKIKRFVSIRQDITKQKKAEEELVKARDMADAANRAKSEFLANMSHELRTPLNSVIGFSKLLLSNKKGHLSQDEMNFARRVNENGRHLLILIDEILDLSKIDAGRMEASIETVEMTQLVCQAGQMIEPQAIANGISFHVEVPEIKVFVKTDPLRMKQILLNLLSNAVKFSKDGTVNMRMKMNDRNRLTDILVEDSGIGIEPERLKTIFKPFKQADNTIARSYGGTGLGLAIVKKLAQMLGCSIHVNSKVGKGSCFILSFHESLAATGSSASQSTVGEHAVSLDAGSLKSRRILIIDDDESAIRIMTERLEDHGCIVRSEINGKKGRATAREFSPDLILLDLVMPGESGWETLTFIKNDDALNAIPVVVISMYTKDFSGLVHGAVNIAPKPISEADLLDVVRQYIPLRGSSVMVVDDDASTRDLIGSILNDHGVESVSYAENGRQALDLLDASRPGMILLDLLMPEMGGVAFLKELRKNKAFRSTPVIIMTSQDLSERERNELRKETRKILHKGMAFENSLVEMITSMLKEDAS